MTRTANFAPAARQFVADTQLETDQWENGELGRDAAYAAVSRKAPALVDEATGLQMISIRLPKELIENFKLIASANGMGYQPLMRTCLQRFADSELKLFGKEYLSKNAPSAAAKTPDHVEALMGR